MRRPRWSASPPRSADSALERLEGGGGAGADESGVARHREKAKAPRGKRVGALGARRIGAGDLAGLARRRADRLDRSIDLARMRIERLAVAERERKVGGADEHRVDSGGGENRLEVAQRLAGL